MNMQEKMRVTKDSVMMIWVLTNMYTFSTLVFGLDRLLPEEESFAFVVTL
jgi:hypothetical protein